MKNLWQQQQQRNKKKNHTFYFDTKTLTTLQQVRSTINCGML